MKKNLILIALVGISLSVVAQVPKRGAILAGGDISFNANKVSDKDAITGFSTESNIIGFAMGPKIGYTLMEGLIVGGILQFSASSTKANAGGLKITNSSLAAGPFARYYLPMGIFGEASFVAGVQTSKTTSGGVSSPKNKNNLSDLFIGAGYAYFLTPSVSVEPLIGFGYDRIKFDNNDVLKNRGLRFKISLSVYLRNE